MLSSFDYLVGAIAGEPERPQPTKKKDRWNGDAEFSKGNEEYFKTARQFYDTPSLSSAVVETVYRKPTTYVNQHASSGNVVRVPTAIGYHSMDSMDEYEEAKSRASRYDFFEEEEPKEPEPEERNPEEDKITKANSKEPSIEEVEEREVYDRYGGAMEQARELLQSMNSNDSDSCAPVWRSFDEEQDNAEAERDRMIAAAARANKLNYVPMPKNYIDDWNKDKIPVQVELESSSDLDSSAASTVNIERKESHVSKGSRLSRSLRKFVGRRNKNNSKSLIDRTESPIPTSVSEKTSKSSLESEGSDINRGPNESSDDSDEGVNVHARETESVKSGRSIEHSTSKVVVRRKTGTTQPIARSNSFNKISQPEGLPNPLQQDGEDDVSDNSSKASMEEKSKAVSRSRSTANAASHRRSTRSARTATKNRVRASDDNPIGMGLDWIVDGFENLANLGMNQPTFNFFEWAEDELLQRMEDLEDNSTKTKEKTEGGTMGSQKSISTPEGPKTQDQEAMKKRIANRKKAMEAALKNEAPGEIVALEAQTQNTKTVVDPKDGRGRERSSKMRTSEDVKSAEASKKDVDEKQELSSQRDKVGRAAAQTTLPNASQEKTDVPEWSRTRLRKTVSEKPKKADKTTVDGAKLGSKPKATSVETVKTPEILISEIAFPTPSFPEKKEDDDGANVSLLGLEKTEKEAEKPANEKSIKSARSSSSTGAKSARSNTSKESKGAKTNQSIQTKKSQRSAQSKKSSAKSVKSAKSTKSTKSQKTTASRKFTGLLNKLRKKRTERESREHQQ